MPILSVEDSFQIFLELYRAVLADWASAKIDG